MKHLLRFLLSPFTIITMMTAVGAASFMGTIIPQRADHTPRFLAAWQAADPLKYTLIKLLQLDRIYTSVWFLALIALIACSLCCSLYYQTRKVLRPPNSTSGNRGKRISRFAFKCRAVAARETVRVQMKKQGYHPSTTESTSNNLVFNKNITGRWGGVVFHLGLLCILLSGLGNAALRQRGLAILSVGETFAGQTSRWASTRTGILAGQFKPEFTARLDKFQPQYWPNSQVKTIHSEVTVVERDGKSTIVPIAINNPGKINGIRLLLSGDYGYTLDLLLNSNSAHPVLSHILLDAPAHLQDAISYDMIIPTTAYHLHIDFHPGFRKPSMLLTSPGADFTVKVSGAPPLRTRLFPGQSIVLPLGDTLTFNRVSYWTGIIFAKSYGMPLLYAGFGLCIAGAFLMYMLPVKVAYIQISPARVEKQKGGARLQQISISGQTRRYQPLFSQELQEIAAELQKTAPT